MRPVPTRDRALIFAAGHRIALDPPEARSYICRLFECGFGHENSKMLEGYYG